MVKKFHINKKGVPAPCRAKDGNCPLKRTNHYDSFREAQAAINKMNEDEFGILPESKMLQETEEVKPIKQEPKITKRQQENTQKKESLNRNMYNDKKYERKTRVKEYRKAWKKEDLEYIENRLNELIITKPIGGKKTYAERCRSVKKDHNFIPPRNVKSAHFRKERTERSNQIEETFGKGKLIGFYEVDHEVGTLKKKEFKVQMIEIRDNGSLTIYDINTGKKVTTFIAPSKRIETMLLMAGEIPDESLLKKFEKNKIKAVENKING